MLEEVVAQAVSSFVTGGACVAVVHGGCRHGEDGDGGPVPAGSRLATVVTAAAVLALCAEGMLSRGTTVGECVPCSQAPAGVDRSVSVHELLGRLSAGGPPAEAANQVLHRFILAASGEDARSVVTRLVLDAHGMSSTSPVAGTTSPVDWTTTAADVAALAAGDAWLDVAAAGALGRPTGAPPRVGLTGGTGEPMVWRYVDTDLGVAVLGDVAGGTAVLGALDAAVTGS